MLFSSCMISLINRAIQSVRVLIPALMLLWSANSSSAIAKVFEEYVLKYKVIKLTNEFKFSEARNAINDYVRSNEAPVAEMLKAIELHYMPRSKLTPAEEEALQKVSSLDSILANSRSLELCKQCVRQYPKSEYAHIMLSRLYFWQLKDSLAVSEARKACEIAPENLHALENFFQCCVFAHRKKDAAKVLSAIVKTDPRHQLGAEYGSRRGKSGADDFFDPLIDRRALKKVLKRELEEEMRNSGQ